MPRVLWEQCDGGISTLTDLDRGTIDVVLISVD